MILELVKEMNGNEFVKEMEKKYGSIDKLKRLMEKDPENVLYSLDLDDWTYSLEHPDGPIKQTETLFGCTLDIEMFDLKLLSVIKKQPTSIKDLAYILDADVEFVQSRVQKLVENGLLKFEQESKNNKIPVINFIKLKIEI